MRNKSLVFLFAIFLNCVSFVLPSQIKANINENMDPIFQQYEIKNIDFNEKINADPILLNNGKIFFWGYDNYIYNPTENKLEQIREIPKLVEMIDIGNDNFLAVRNISTGYNNYDKSFELFNLKTKELSPITTLNVYISWIGKINKDEVLIFTFHNDNPAHRKYIKYSIKENKFYDDVEVKGLELGGEFFYSNNKLYADTSDGRTLKIGDEYKEKAKIDPYYKNRWVRIIKEYNEKENRFDELGFAEVKWGYKGTVLKGNKYLFAGGFKGGTTYLDDAELTDFKTKKVVKAKLNIARGSDGIIALDDGNALVLNGAADHEFGHWQSHNSVELYVVSENRFVLFKTRNKRLGSSSIKMQNGDIMIYGPTTSNDKSGREVYEAEIFHKKGGWK